MSAKQISYDAAAREHIREGVKKLARAVKVTLGPRGRNVIIEKSFGSPTVTITLSEEELDVYRAPFLDRQTRARVLLATGPATAAIRGRTASASSGSALVNEYADWLRDTQIPKLLLYATPGLIASRSAVRQANKTFTNLESVSLGRGKHFLPEDHPDAIAEAIVTFVDRI